MLCTQTEVERKLQWDITADPDSVVTQHIADAQALIESEIGRTIESASRAETFDGAPWTIHLTYWPVTAVAQVDEDGVTLTANDDYIFTEKGKLMRVANGYQRSWANYKPQSIDVTYTGGYLSGHSDEHDMALEHLGSLCAEIVARAFRRGADNAAIAAGSSGAIESVTLEGAGTVSYGTATDSFQLDGGLGQFVIITDDEKAQLKRYRRTWLGVA